MKGRYKTLRVLGIITVFFLFALFILFRPLKDTPLDTSDFKPISDPALARKFAPKFIAHSEYGKPEKILFRMALAANGQTHIAYHPWYATEFNPHAGFMPLLSRILYTGGLGIKDTMFGPNDIELIEIILDSAGNPIKLSYESAMKYRKTAFGVTHKAVEETLNGKPQNYCFKVTTWNHMVDHVGSSACNAQPEIPLAYFTNAEWEASRMVKRSEAILRRNRAHRVYERLGVE